MRDAPRIGMSDNTRRSFTRHGDFSFHRLLREKSARLGSLAMSARDFARRNSRERKVARHCFISRRRRRRRLFLSLPLVAVYSSFSSRALCRFLSPASSPAPSPAHVHIRPIQMAKVNFAITKYLARKSLREPPTISAAPPPPSTAEKLPLDFGGEKGSQPTPPWPYAEGHRNLLCRGSNLRPSI